MFVKMAQLCRTNEVKQFSINDSFGNIYANDRSIQHSQIAIRQISFIAGNRMNSRLKQVKFQQLKVNGLSLRRRSDSCVSAWC